MIREINPKMYDSVAARPWQDNLENPVAVSSTKTFYSTPICLNGCDSLCVQAVWTGTPVGTLTLECSNDPKTAPYWEAQMRSATDGVANTWTAPTTGGTFPASPAGGASSVIEQFSGLACMWVRVKYVNASGSGTLALYATAKE
jgi:hypothetical protein